MKAGNKFALQKQDVEKKYKLSLLRRQGKQVNLDHSHAFRSPLARQQQVTTIILSQVWLLFKMPQLKTDFVYQKNKKSDISAAVYVNILSPILETSKHMSNNGEVALKHIPL